MDFKSLFNKLFPDKAFYEEYLFWRKHTLQERADQIAHWQQMETRRVEMEEMTNDFEDDDFSDEADDIWQRIKSETR